VTLEATDGVSVQGRLEGEFPAPRLFARAKVVLAPGAREDLVHRAFADAVAAAYAESGGEVVAWENPDEAAWRAALEAAGFRPVRRKAFVERTLDDLPSVPPGLVLRSLAEVGERAFCARMAEASEGDPFEERKGAERDLDREWRELVSYAGDLFRPDRWWTVDDDSGPVGVVLPQAFSTEKGTLFYLGVLPHRRGVGLGRALHAQGLHLLAAQGLRRYVGSTDLRNEPMRRVFERNGCRVKGVQVYFEVRPRDRGGR
jgi:RimJ/RimL family protein N-acetyltransferase